MVGRSQTDAREQVIDALVELPSLEPDGPTDAKTERLKIALTLGRSIDHDLER
jgi:hypothetical protein